LVYGSLVTSPLDLHRSTPRELQERIAAERAGHAFLLLRDGADRQVIVELAGRERLTLGRRGDIRLDWDDEVSRVHAALERLGDEWLISDDGLSRNGTWVNGERVTGRRRLRDGDVIAAGRTIIAFRSPAEEPAEATASAAGPGLDALITPAQRRVLVALCRPFRDGGYAAPATNQQIAAELVVSVDAVKSTLTALFTAFGVDHLPQNQKRATLALQALRTGVVSRRDL
jgi:pSer/pThr/pTyr-binding forkhead associated (FHA) protein